jgi:transketolase
MPIEPIDKKFESFGWRAIKIDGHDFEEIIGAFAEARQEKDRPTCIIAKTIKGKGVCYMENQLGWHGKAPNDEEFDIAISDICKSKGSY